MSLEKKFEAFITDFRSEIESTESELTILRKKVNEDSDETISLRKQVESLLAEKKTLEKEKEQAVANVKSSLQNEMDELKARVEPLQTEKDRLFVRMGGLENTIRVISEWVPSQKESIEVLVALASAPGEFQNVDEIGKMSKIAGVVLKNRILPMLIEKGFVIMENDQVKMKPVE